MCIICISKSGVRQPSEQEFSTMWNANPHGAGYMCIRDGMVEIHKGFMTYKEFRRNVDAEKFTDNDVVIYHFRISTQAGVNPHMTHPFPLTDDVENTRLLDLRCNVGIAHNGIIRITSNGDKEYSDTALFIANYLPALIRDIEDVQDATVQRCISDLIGSKMAFLTYKGDVVTVGKFITDNSGLIFSNDGYKEKQFFRTYSYMDRNLHWAM